MKPRSAGHFYVSHMKPATFAFACSFAGVSASAFGFLGFGGDSWREEALQPDGTKIIVKRTVSRKGRHEIGQRSAIGDQTLEFDLPGTGQQMKWEDTYSEDVGNGNFSPLLLGVLRDKAYVLTSPKGCLSYNKWGRPNPPYVVFRHEGTEWKRIGIAELPTEFKLPNLIISSPDDQVEKSGLRFLRAELVGRMNQGFAQPEYKAIVREPLATERCPRYSSGPKPPIPIPQDDATNEMRGK